MAGSRRSLGRTRQDVEGLRVLLCSNIFGTGFLFGRPGFPSVWGVCRNCIADIMSVILFRSGLFEQTDHSRDRAMPTPTFWGPEFRINSTTEWGQLEPIVIGLPDGSFFAVWTSATATASVGGEICGQKFDAAGIALREELLISTTPTESSISFPAIASRAWSMRAPR